VAPMEPWERVRVDAETYAEDIHSYINCTECHLGQAVDDMALAHEGMVESPTDDAQRTCGSCHETITTAAADSLHNTLAGYDTVLYERSLPEDHPQIEEAEANHCNSCHASCGDCHVSQPSNVGGGLLEGHQFVEEPSMSRNCTACHGSRVKDEYYGAHEGLTSDVHFRARMACNDCHTADEMHGVGMDAAHRYDGAPQPACESCHEEQVGVGSGIYQHEVHGTETMSCQTCHSVSYTNCTNCHVEQTADNVPFYSVESHDLMFVIGRNELRSNERPYDWVPVRHVPVDIESFSYYDVILENFDTRPTWVYATPHNIQRNTPQTESCTTCHGNDALFLSTAIVAPEEWAANANTMVDEAPPLPDGYENVVTGQDAATDAAAEADSTDGGFWGETPSDDEASDNTGNDSGFWEADEDADDEAPSDDFWGGGETDTPTDEAPSDDFWGGGENDAATDEDDSSEDFWGEGTATEPTSPTEAPSADDFWGG